MSSIGQRGTGQQPGLGTTPVVLKTGCLGSISGCLGSICSKCRKCCSKCQKCCSKCWKSRISQTNNSDSNPKNIYANGMHNSNMEVMNSSNKEAIKSKQGNRNGELKIETVGRVEPLKGKQKTEFDQGNFDVVTGDNRYDSLNKPGNSIWSREQENNNGRDSMTTSRGAEQASQQYLSTEQQEDSEKEDFNKYGNHTYTNSANIINKGSKYLEEQKEGGEKQTNKISSPQTADLSVGRGKQKDAIRQVSVNKDNNHRETSSPKTTESSKSISEQAGLFKVKQKDFVRQVSFNKDDNNYTESSSSKITESMIISEHAGLSKEKQKDFGRQLSFNKENNYRESSSPKITGSSRIISEQAGLPKEKQKDFVRQVSFNKDSNYRGSSSPQITKSSMSISEQAGFLKEKQKDFVRPSSFPKDDDNYTNDGSIVHTIEQKQKSVLNHERQAERQISKIMSSPESEQACLSKNEQKDFVWHSSFNKDG